MEKKDIVDKMREVRDGLSAALTTAYNTPPSDFRTIAQELVRLSTELAFASQDAENVAKETVTEEDKRPSKKPVESLWPPYVFKSDMRR